MLADADRDADASAKEDANAADADAEAMAADVEAIDDMTESAYVVWMAVKMDWGSSEPLNVWSDRVMTQ